MKKILIILSFLVSSQLFANNFSCAVMQAEGNDEPITLGGFRIDTDAEDTEVEKILGPFYAYCIGEEGKLQCGFADIYEDLNTTQIKEIIRSSSSDVEFYAHTTIADDTEWLLTSYFERGYQYSIYCEL